MNVTVTEHNVVSRAMSEDEVVVTVVSILTGPAAWLLWLFRMGQARDLRYRGSVNALAAALVVAAALIFLVLKTAASFDVVDDVCYQFMYFVLGLAWLRMAQSSFALAGVSARDDVVERGNVAATIALCGALIGAALCYAGGNIGDGPGWWVVVFCAALSTGAFLLGWTVLASTTAIADSVVIDRDPAAGVRLGGFLVGLGLVLGRAVAGDWHSGSETITDFIAALPPALVILVAAFLVERVAGPTPEHPQREFVSTGVAPALLYLGLAATAVRLLGWPA
jgi:uncharacterized membrane protein YjfL (UPF0719 family)